MQAFSSGKWHKEAGCSCIPQFGVAIQNRIGPVKECTGKLSSTPGVVGLAPNTPPTKSLIH